MRTSTRTIKNDAVNLSKAKRLLTNTCLWQIQERTYFKKFSSPQHYINPTANAKC